MTKDGDEGEGTAHAFEVSASSWAPAGASWLVRKRRLSTGSTDRSALPRIASAGAADIMREVVGGWQQLRRRRGSVLA